MPATGFDAVAIGPTAGNGLYSPAVGGALVAQTITVNRDGTLVQTGSCNLPRNASIIGFDVLVDTAYDSGTSASLTIGTAAAGSQYMSGLDVKTGGVRPVAGTAAQTTSMKDIGVTNLGVFATVTSVGQPSVGSVRVVVRYLVPLT